MYRYTLTDPRRVRYSTAVVSSLALPVSVPSARDSVTSRRDLRPDELERARCADV